MAPRNDGSLYCSAGIPREVLPGSLGTDEKLSDNAWIVDKDSKLIAGSRASWAMANAAGSKLCVAAASPSGGRTS